MVGSEGFEPSTNGSLQADTLQNFVIPKGSSKSMLSGARRTTCLYYNPTLFLHDTQRNYKKDTGANARAFARAKHTRKSHTERKRKFRKKES